MAKMISTKRRRSSGGKVRKAAKRATRRVIVQTKKVYKRAKGINVTTKDVVISVAAGGAGAIGSAFVLKKLPIENEVVKNAAVIALGGFLTYKGVKKRNMAMTGAGMGMAAVGASNVITKFIPSATMAAPFVNPSLAAPIRNRRPALAAPFVRPSFVARTVKEEDYI